MKLKTEVTLAALFIAFVPVVIASIVVGSISISSGQQALKSQSERQLISIRDITAKNIESYFETIEGQVATFSNDRMIINAMAGFKVAFSEYREEQDTNIADSRRELAQYYDNEFKNTYRDLNSGKSPNTTNLLEGLDDDSIALQHAYIYSNSNPLGEKDSLNQYNDDTQYSKLHGLYHPSIRQYLKRFEFYDIFLVDHQTGDIVYSVYKELDYTTSLISGPYAQSGIGKAFLQANQLDGRDAAALTDFAPYLPSYEAPAAFIASPIYDGNKKIGILIFQMPIDRINAVMTHYGQWEESGLGKSGESYLVGSDLTMRSVSRFLLEDKEAYIKLLESINLNEDVISEIAAKGTSIGLQPINTPGVKSALAGETGFSLFPDYRGIDVLSAYRPLKINGVDWVLMSEIDQSEAYQSIADVTEDIVSAVVVTTLCAIVVGGLLGTLFASRVITPISLTVSMVKDIAQGEGDLRKRLRVIREDEMGELANWFNQFVHKLQDLIVNLNGSVQQLAQSSEGMENIAGSTMSTMSNQHQRIEMMTIAITEMNTVTEDISKNAQTAAGIAKDTFETSQQGLKVISSCQEAIAQLAGEIENSTSVISALNKDSDEIGKMLEAIEGIAEQTNLLALNAAIEAARAGESGRGFAVVADEVRTLAQRTQDSTGEIKNIITRLQSGTSKAVEAMELSQKSTQLGVDKANQAKTSFTDITNAISNITDTNTQIATAAEEQTATTAQIHGSIEEISSMSKETTDNAGNIVSASQQLVSLASSVRVMLGDYKV